MLQRVYRFVFLNPLCVADLIPAQRSFQLPHEDFEFPELVEDGLMCKVLDVFDEVVVKSKGFLTMKTKSKEF